MTVNFENSLVYVNSNIRKFIMKLVDLYCLEDVDINFIIRRTDGRTGYTSNFVGYKATDPNKPNDVNVGSKGGIRASTIAHEMLHVAGYDHEYEINGYSDFRHIHYSAPLLRKGTAVDNYSRLVVKDLTGKYEVFL